MVTFCADIRSAIAKTDDTLTTSSVGIPVTLNLADEFNGLAKTLCFKTETKAVDIALVGDAVESTIPPDVLTTPGEWLSIGIYAADDQGNIVIPTVWAKAGIVVLGTLPAGVDPAAPTPSWVAQVQNIASEALVTANSVREDADEGKFDGDPGPIGPTPDISIGTVTTGAAGSQAEATMTGTPERPVLNLTIPRGDPGEVTQAEFDELADEVSQQKSAIEDLTALVDRKAGMLVDTASGTIASFSPDATIPDLLGVTVDIEPVQDLHGYDNPWPAGGGKNKLHNTATTTTDNGVTFTVNADGSVSCAGTATATAVFRMFQTFAITEDIILNGCPSGGDYYSGYSMLMADSRGASVTPNVASVDIGNGVTIAAQYVGQIAQIQIIVRSGTNMDGKVFYPMIRLASDTDATFAPYENICPISGWDSVEVDANGVNLFGGTVINGRVPFDLKPGVTYTASAQFVDPSVSTYFYIQRAPKGTGTYSTFGYILTNYARTPVTFTADAGYDYAFWSNASYANVKDVQIETGSTAHAYHPYAGNTYTIALGDTVYGGTLDATAGTLTVDRAMVDMGTLTWTKNESSLIGLPCFTATLPGVKPGAPYFNCSEYAIKRDRDAINGTAQISPGNGSNATYCVVRDDRYADSTAADFKTAMSGVQLVYPLASPVVIQLDPVTIATIAGQTNNVWSDAGDVSVEFAADLKAYIDSKIAAAVAALS